MLGENFLLKNDWGRLLFHQYAKEKPIIDYHCHLDPKTILENKPYQNLTQLWLNDNGTGDHYKWRLMRTNGVPEEFISGDGDDKKKFDAFVDTMEKAIGNPIYEWSHLELRRYFDIALTLNKKNKDQIWGLANQAIADNQYRPVQLLQKMNVKVVCTTDDPIDSLKYHMELGKIEEETGIRVLPTFRPDQVWQINKQEFSDYLLKLECCTNQSIRTFAELTEALAKRISHFHQVGGRLADHGMNQFFYQSSSENELDTILQDALQGKTDFSRVEQAKFMTGIQLALMKEYCQHGWTMQMHMNVLRDGSPKLFNVVGKDAGGDSMGDQPELASQIVQLFGEAQRHQIVPKTIFYSLNPSDWLPLATAMQSFQGGIVQKFQLGCAWWFNDTYGGMRKQLTIQAEQSLLGNFTGMLTDSRSFLSYPRHEYFRRILCSLVGEWIEAGRLPQDEAFIGKLIEDICYDNAKRYFGF